jgi:putative beta-1,4-xylosyltransferase IRX9
MASIRRPHSPAKQQHLLRHHHHPFATSTSPPSSPLRHSSSSPRKTSGTYPPHPFLFLSRRPLPRFAAFFILGSFIGLLHFLSHLPHPHHPLHHPSLSSPSLPSATTTTPTVHLSHPTEQQDQDRTNNHDQLLIVVTPTRARAAQALYLGRMAHTLRLVRPPLLWLVVEAGAPTPEAAAALRRTSLMHRYVGCCRNFINASSSSSSSLAYRPHQINAALDLVEDHRLHGVVYFADEEGVYSLRLFDRLRQIRYFYRSIPFNPPAPSRFRPPKKKAIWYKSSTYIYS